MAEHLTGREQGALAPSAIGEQRAADQRPTWL
jgi:hypothetical protein